MELKAFVEQFQAQTPTYDILHEYNLHLSCTNLTRMSGYKDDISSSWPPDYILHLSIYVNMFNVQIEDYIVINLNSSAVMMIFGIHV